MVLLRRLFEFCGERLPWRSEPREWTRVAGSRNGTEAIPYRRTCTVAFRKTRCRERLPWRSEPRERTRVAGSRNGTEAIPYSPVPVCHRTQTVEPTALPGTRRAAILLAALLAVGAARVAAAELPAAEVLVRLIDEVDVPARVPGVVRKVAVREGQAVAEGSVVACIDDAEARFARRQAELELQLARDQAKNDVRVRYATKSLEVARAELARAVESEKKYRKSVSQSELEELRLAAERARLEIEQAEWEMEVASASCQVKANDLAAARWQLERHQIVAPLAGVIAQIYRKPGEWVVPGDKVVRIVRVDRLRAEGFLPARDADGSLVGRRVSLSVQLQKDARTTFTGQIVFISSEVDPVNGQVRVWAEVDNRQGKLRPGLRGVLTILEPAARSEQGPAEATPPASAASHE